MAWPSGHSRIVLPVANPPGKQIVKFLSENKFVIKMVLVRIILYNYFVWNAHWLEINQSMSSYLNLQTSLKRRFFLEMQISMMVSMLILSKVKLFFIISKTTHGGTCFWHHLYNKLVKEKFSNRFNYCITSFVSSCHSWTEFTW